MPLFKVSGSSLSEIHEAPFKLERDLQKLTEENLETLFGLEFISTEFERDGLRIDTLAFDPESKSFVVIEYKRDQSFSIVDQGFAYLALLLNNKEVFLVEYNERRNQRLRRDDVDWSQSRVVFIAKSFTTHQTAAASFKDLAIELWQVSRFKPDLVLYDRLNVRKTASVGALKPEQATAEVVKQVKAYTEADLVPKDGKTKLLYEELRARILQIDGNLRPHPTKTYIAFREGEDWRNIFSIQFQTSRLKLLLYRTQPANLTDPEKKVSYIENSPEYWNQHISSFDLREEKELDYAIYLLQQVLERFRDSR